jgi:hypothetical protein
VSLPHARIAASSKRFLTILAAAYDAPYLLSRPVHLTHPALVVLAPAPTGSQPLCTAIHKLARVTCPPKHTLHSMAPGTVSAIHLTDPTNRSFAQARRRRGYYKTFLHTTHDTKNGPDGIS